MPAGPATSHPIDTAVAPSASRFMWQNLQTRFRNKAGKPCRADVSMGATQGAICFVAPGHRLRCAGQIGEKNYGSTFRYTGQTNVKQLLLRDGGASMCSLSRTGRLACLSVNFRGELARDEFSSTTFLPWGDPNQRYTNVATADGGQIGARRTDGQIFCAGDFATPDGVEVTTGTPVLVGMIIIAATHGCVAARSSILLIGLDGIHEGLQLSHNARLLLLRPLLFWFNGQLAPVGHKSIVYL